jgi:3-oxoacyl-[acyl-carrier protein] reductase
MRFDGKKAVVVGGGGGMGRAICCGFAKEGADVAVLDLVLENAEKVAKEVRDSGHKAIAMKVDIGDFKTVHDCINGVYKEFKHIDILVNGAGYGDLVPFAEMTEETWDRCIATHLKGTFNAMRAVINGMISQHSGRIISISSIAGVTGTPKHCQYSAAKAGVIGLTKALAKEVASEGITVNAIAPGAIKTPFVKNVPQSSLDIFIKATLAGRWGTPEEIAALVLYLASDEAGFVTGQVININGGQYI